MSNFQPAHLERIIAETGVAPVINQVELHPYFQQTGLRREHADLGIVTEAWSPLAQGKVLDDPALIAIAETHGVTTGQVTIRWHLQLGNVVIPKSVTQERIEQNLDVFGFTLSAAEMAAIARARRGRPDRAGSGHVRAAVGAGPAAPRGEARVVRPSLLSPLRPKPFRGDVVAAGVVVLTTLVWVVTVRFADAWGAGVHLAYATVACAFVTAMGVLSPMEGDEPRAYQSVLYVASVALFIDVVAQAQPRVGCRRASSSSGTADLGAGGRRGVRADVCDAAQQRRLHAAGIAGRRPCGDRGGRVDLVAERPRDATAGSCSRSWSSSASPPSASATAACATASRSSTPRVSRCWRSRGASWPRTFSRASGRGRHESVIAVAWGWELLILAAGFGLIAYSSVDRQPGPAYLGVLNLIAFTVITSLEIDADGATLLGWPLVLAGAAVFLLIVGLRPTTPAPPPPDIDAPEPPPLPLR